MSLWDIFVNHRGRPIHKWAHYFAAYERHFDRFVGTPVTFVEIGCGDGGSAQMWKQYLGPEAVVVGVDIRPDAAAFEEDHIKIRIGDQADTGFLESLIEEFGAPHAVLDDGSHRMSDVRTTFKYLYPRIASDGVYVIEDLQTAYWPEFGGGLRHRGSFIEQAKSLVDELNAHSIPGSRLRPTAFTDTTVSMHFYDGLVAFERGTVGERHSIEVRNGKLTARDIETNRPPQRSGWKALVPLKHRRRRARQR